MTEDYAITREREDLERLCDAIEKLSAVIRDINHKKTDFVIKDRLTEELGDCIEYSVDAVLDPIYREAQHRITELKP